ncbi:hypothetical protein [Archangium lansingense]|uniref:Uncharacterized protein n=1 Tax=Archangium lansingense TaxID=2995310 RepID=A0ABT3ZWT0_9BACT|nr:hypothetical protein [Archangium lansinium]MCY1073859.1 hypothetical protein [Archangium lansinium]
MSGYLFTSKHHGLDVEVDLSSQVLELEVDEQESFLALLGATPPATAARHQGSSGQRH